MMSQEKNDEITLVGADQPAGKVLRQYWMPAALSDELMGPRPVVAVTLLGEKLVLFRDERGNLGLIARYCPHRGADLCFGRLENNGLRCPFHGWHFDVSGQCVDTPGEPEGSTLFKNITTPSYPVVENNGIIWAYMGQGTPPEFPALDCFKAPDSHVFAFKGLWQCNWLQALEVGIDPAHASFLHRFLQDEDPKDSYGKQFRDAAPGTDIPMTQVLREFPRPEINVEDTDYGLRLLSLRDLKNGSTHVRITNQVFPCAITIPISSEMTITQWHVPIDDVNCYWFSMFTSFGNPVDKVKMREQRLREHRLPDYAPLKNAANNYGYDADEQNNLTYTGMGLDINVHDQWAVEAMGAIQDRREEHLGKSDVAIIAYRRKLRAAIADLAAGDANKLPMANGGLADVKGPISIDTIAPSDDWQSSWPAADAARRESCPWDADI
ncbi:MAG: aromatic ring-hydroxylating dioxygenase subunit alpha [Alphaproteobacteria bacterium]|nr:aromatic ring-hydroxylating dioxygenase subunit alpha [Alphaproteobacteria bacterium]